MKRIILIILGSINICLAYAQSFNGQYISEWQWDMNKNTNLINQLRLELSVPIGKGKDSFEAATLHVAKTNDGIIDDWQGFSNIDAVNKLYVELNSRCPLKLWKDRLVAVWGEETK